MHDVSLLFRYTPLTLCGFLLFVESLSRSMMHLHSAGKSPIQQYKAGNKVKTGI